MMRSFLSLAAGLLSSLACASYLLTFRCCDGLAFSPVPLLGYLRWDVSLGIWVFFSVVVLVLSAILAAAIQFSFSGKGGMFCWRRNVLLVVAAQVAWFALQKGDYWMSGDELTKRVAHGLILLANKQVSRVPYTQGFGSIRVYDTIFSHLDQVSLPRVNTSDGPVLSPGQCDQIVAGALSRADEWMNSNRRLPGTAYLNFGGDVNFGAAWDGVLRPAWYEDAPWLSDYLPAYNFENGFFDIGRDSLYVLKNETYIGHVKSLYQSILSPHLQDLREGLARHVGIAPSALVLGGDEDSVLSDFSPPAVMAQLPHVMTQYYANPHTDFLTPSVDKILRRLRQQQQPQECLGGTDLFGGTIALQLPKDGAGMLWWQRTGLESPSSGEDSFYTPYHRGNLATVPGSVKHCIAPWKYSGWTDQARITLQMFMLECWEDADRTSSKWYVFH